ncbi:MAG: hypothetical protein J5842_06715 [Lachnospiraceae bacterium]|nr:hypothetical protein [Lachnospiraceae bacterium]
MSRPLKGQHGYLKYKKSSETVKTLIYFAIPLALFFAGYITAGTKRNLLTIVAVLGFLPASKNAVLMIMYLKSRLPGEVIFEKIENTVNSLPGDIKKNLIPLYDMVFTTSDHSFDVPALIIYGGSVLGYLCKKDETGSRTDNKDKGKKKGVKASKTELLEKHLSSTLKKEGITATVKIYDRTEAFTDRVGGLNVLERAGEKQDEHIRKVLCDISL